MTEATSNVILVVNLIGISVVCFGVLSYLYSLIYWQMRQFIQLSSPNQHSILLLLISVSAPILTLFSVFAFMMPNAVTLPQLYKHCHTNLCSPHVPSLFQSNHYKIILLISLVIFALALFGVFYQLQKTLSKKITGLYLMLADDRPLSQNNYLQIVHTDFPLLLNVGTFKPQIVMSEALINNLSKQQYQRILMYELTRCKRLDNLRVLLAKVGTIGWPTKIKSQLLKELTNVNHAATRLTLQRAAVIKEQVDIDSLPIALPNYITLWLCKNLNDAKHQRQHQQSNPPSMQPQMVNQYNNPLGLSVFVCQHVILLMLTISGMHFITDFVMLN